MGTIRIHFIKNTEVTFLNPKTGKKEWYGSDYWQGTSIEVSDILSGNTQEIRVRCLDGEIGILKTDAVRF